MGIWIPVKVIFPVKISFTPMARGKLTVRAMEESPCGIP